MSLKISASMSAVAHHVIDGPFAFPYAIDAHSAVARFPEEWSLTPWSRDAEAKAREAAGQEAVELSVAEREELEQHTRAVEEAKQRLKAFHEKKAAEKREADQAALDEAVVASVPPRPGKRPFGRPGEPTAAEIESQRKRDEKKAAGDKAAKEKADQDAIARSNAQFTS